MNKILELSTPKGRLKEGQFITYNGDENVQVYSILNTETIQAFYPSEDGSLIEIKIDALSY
jgi:hypothetical protein